MSSDTVKQRVVKVFISSTFRDMNAERDYLNKYIFPHIHSYCDERYIEFYPIDLRWGIREEDTRNGLVMTSCLEQIDDSRPFFIGILGSRYGWIPTQNDVNLMRSSDETQKSWITSKINEHASITEIEMEYGALANSNISDACFLIREDTMDLSDDFKEKPGSLEDRKLKDLKNRVRSQSVFPVHSYSSLEEFGRIIHDELMSMIIREFPSNVDDYQESLISRHEYTYSRRCNTLWDLGNVYSNCDRWLDSGKQFLLIRGEAGSGTSTACANIVRYLRERYDSPIIYYDFEEEDMNGDVIATLQEFLKQKNNHIDPQAWSLIVLDNCSILNQDEVFGLMEWMSTLSTGTHVIVTASNFSPADILIQRYLYPPVITIHGLTEEDSRKEFASNYLLRYGKKISDIQLEQLVKVENTKDPTYLSFALNNLVNYGSFEHFDEYLQNIIKEAKSDDVFSIWDGIRSQTRDIDAVNCGDDYAKAIILLAQMQHIGISERDICTIAEISTAKWAIIRPYIYKWCKGNKTKLVFIKSQWEPVIKNIYSTPWQASLGVQAINWYIENRSFTIAANAAASIWAYIWHLPIDLAIGQEAYTDFKQKLFDFACSPDVVIRLNTQSLTWLLKYLLHDHEIKDFKNRFGRDINILSFEEKETYYLNLIQVFNNLNSGSDMAYCYTQLAEVVKKHGNVKKASYYEALSFLVTGKAQEAIDTVRPLITDEKSTFLFFKSKSTLSDEEKKISTMAQCLIYQAYSLSVDVSASENDLNKLQDKVVRILAENSRNNDKAICKTVNKTAIDVLYMLCYTNRRKEAVSFYNAICDKIDLSWKSTDLEHYAKYLISYSLVLIFAQSNKEDRSKEYNASCNAGELAWLAGKEYMQNQSCIIADYIYFKVHGQYRPRSFQIYKHQYNPPRLYNRSLQHHTRKSLDWRLVDIGVRKNILAERDFYKNLIYEIQPEHIRQQMLTEEDILMKEMLL